MLPPECKISSQLQIHWISQMADLLHANPTWINGCFHHSVAVVPEPYCNGWVFEHSGLNGTEVYYNGIWEWQWQWNQCTDNCQCKNVQSFNEQKNPYNGRQKGWNRLLNTNVIANFKLPIYSFPCHNFFPGHFPNFSSISSHYPEKWQIPEISRLSDKWSFSVY